MYQRSRSLTGDEVKVGDELPELRVPITATTVVQGAVTSRDWLPQHHDDSWAIRVGTNDIFLNTPTRAWLEQSLCHRLGRAHQSSGACCLQDADGHPTKRPNDHQLYGHGHARRSRRLCLGGLAVDIKVGGGVVHQRQPHGSTARAVGVGKSSEMF